MLSIGQINEFNFYNTGNMQVWNGEIYFCVQSRTTYGEFVGYRTC